MKTTFRTKTEISVATGTRLGTVDKYLKLPGAPMQGKNGWDREGTLAFFRDQKAKAVDAQTGDNAELKARKLELECKILEERLTAERRANEEADGKLVPVDDAVAIVTRREAEMATRLRVWEESETAKSPSMREIIREAADALRDLMREPVEF